MPPRADRRAEAADPHAPFECQVPGRAPTPGNVFARAVRRVVRHRWEAAAVVAFMVVATTVSAGLHAYPRLAGTLRSAPAIWGSLLLAVAVLWLPIAVIDARRCTRETLLRAQVEADLESRRELDRRAEQRHGEIEQKVRGVLDAGGPDIVYQPVVDMETGVVVAFEALSRFPDAVAPDRWFSDAHEVGLGRQLEIAAVANALRALDRLPGDVALSVNVSPDLLADSDALRTLCGPVAGRLILEVTENMVIDNYRVFGNAIAEVRACGARLAVDDAGAGYASFRHIVDLRPDMIKVDGSLVRHVDEDPARRSLVAAFVSFAEDIGATVVAECVETEAERAELRRRGLRFGQGWLFGKPKPIDELLVEDRRPRAYLRQGTGEVAGTRV